MLLKLSDLRTLLLKTEDQFQKAADRLLIQTTAQALFLEKKCTDSVQTFSVQIGLRVLPILSHRTLKRHT